MKKVLFIILLLIINCAIFSIKIYSNDKKDIKIRLKSDELAIIIIKLDSSTSLLLKKDDIFILYVLEYTDDQYFYNNIELFTDKVDYVFMHEEYGIKFPNKMIIDGAIILNEIRIEPDKIYYKDKCFCINTPKNCEFVYTTIELELSDFHQSIFYDEELSLAYSEKIHDIWNETYKITKNNYTILIIGTDYEVINLPREY